MVERDDEGGPSTVTPGPSLISGATPAEPVAPVSASYIVTASSPTLTAERVLTAGTQMTVADGGPGATVVVSFAPDALGFPGQSGNIAATAIKASAAAGVYAVVGHIKVTGAATAGTISLDAQYVNGGAQNANIFTGFTVAATGMQDGLKTFRHTGGDITVSATITGLVGTPAYEAYFRLVNLS